MHSLYPVQQKHAESLIQSLKNYGVALDASATGTGKTLVASYVSRITGQKPLVVCPKSVIPTWRRWLADQGVEPIGIVNYEKLRTGSSPFGRWANKKWMWDIPQGSLVIWDEAHKCQGTTSLNAKMMLGSKVMANLMLSATCADSPLNLRGPGFLLGLHKWSDFWNWALRNGCRKNPWGGLEFTGKKETLAKLHAEIFPAKGSRLTREDVAEFFQSTQIITEPLDFGDEKIAMIYEEMEKELEELKARASEDTDKSNPLTIQLRSRQQVELLKVPLIVSMVEQYLEEGFSVAVFLNFDASIDAVSEKLPGVLCGKIRGGQSAQEREQAIEAFQSNVTRLVLCNVSAGGVGVSLHDTEGGHPRVALISPSFNAKDIVQTTGRVDRAGGKSPSIQRILFASGTIEEKVEAAMREKIAAMETFNTGAGFVQTAPPPPPVEVTPLKPAQHAEISPSSLHYILSCPGWEKDERSSGRNPVAEEGTKLHKAAETGDYTGLSVEQESLVSLCLQYVESVLARRNITKKYAEIRIPVLDQFGTADLLAIESDCAELFDYKFGYREVENAETNPQGIAYTVGVFDMFPELKTVRVHFMMPRLGKITRASFSRATDYDRLKTELLAGFAAWKRKNPAEFRVSSDTCEFCGARANCPKLAEVAIALAKKRAPEIELPATDFDETTDPKIISETLKMAPVLEKWAQDVRAKALELALYHGTDIPDFMLIEKKTPRAIVSVPGAWELLSDKMTLEDFLDACGEISIVKLENNFAGSSPRGAKGRAKQELENLLRDRGLLKDQSTIHYLKQKRVTE